MENSSDVVNIEYFLKINGQKQINGYAIFPSIAKFQVEETNDWPDKIKLNRERQYVEFNFFKSFFKDFIYVVIHFCLGFVLATSLFLSPFTAKYNFVSLLEKITNTHIVVKLCV